MGEAAGKGKERWPQVRLGDVCTITMGQSPESSSYNDRGDGLPFYQGNADFGNLHPTTRYWCSRPKKLADINDVLISVRAPIGAVNLAVEKCCIGRGLASITAKNNCSDFKYLYYALISKTNELNVKGTGSTFKAIKKTTLEETQIPLPPLPEQRRIAAVLDQVSSLIALRKAQLAKLDLLVKARFVEMFGDPVKNEMGWEVGTIGSICSLIYRYPTFYDIEYVDNGVPVVQIRNLDQGGSIDYDKQKYVHITAETNDRYPQTQLQIKDILMAVRGDGSTAKRIGMVTDKALLYANISPNLLLLRTNQKCIPEYLYNYLTSNSGQKYLEKYITKTAKKTITARNIKSITIPIPPPDIQYEFKENIFKMNNLRKIQNRNLHSLNNIRSRLLQECFG